MLLRRNRGIIKLNNYYKIIQRKQLIIMRRGASAMKSNVGKASVDKLRQIVHSHSAGTPSLSVY